MPDTVPVPWIRWQRYRVAGVVRERESGDPLAGLMVLAFDKDIVSDDFLGECETDAEGRFEIRFTDQAFKDVIETHPDIYLSVFVRGTREPIHDTEHDIRQNAGRDEFFDVEVGRNELAKSGYSGRS